MGMLRRFIKDGAIFAERIGDPSSLVRRGATVFGAPNIVASPFGPALHFNGNPDRIDIPIPEVLKDGTSPWTVLVWAAPDSSDPATNAPIFSSRIDGTHLAVLWHDVAGDPSPAQHNFRLANGGIRTRSSSIPISAGRYDLIGISLGAAVGSGELVVNGISQGNVADLGVFDCWPTKFSLGWMTGSVYWAGTIAMVAIFPRQLSAAEQLGLYKFQTFDYKHNLVSHWHMDDVGIVQDVGWKEVGQTGTVIGNPTLADGIAGGKCLDLDGTGDYVSLGTVAAISSATKFTWALWINQDVIDVNGELLGNALATSQRFWISTRSTGELLLQILGNTNKAEVSDYSTVISAGRWHHIVLVFDGTATGNTNRLKFYVDGVLVTLSYSGTIPAVLLGTSGDAFKIGRGVASTPWAGLLDEPMLFSEPLTNLQVRDLYEQQRAGKAA